MECTAATTRNAAGTTTAARLTAGHAAIDAAAAEQPAATRAAGAVASSAAASEQPATRAATLSCAAAASALLATDRDLLSAVSKLLV